jgi:hypothetical protein
LHDVYGLFVATFLAAGQGRKNILFGAGCIVPDVLPNTSPKTWNAGSGTPASTSCHELDAPNMKVISVWT